MAATDNVAIPCYKKHNHVINCTVRSEVLLSADITRSVLESVVINVRWKLPVTTTLSSEFWLPNVEALRRMLDVFSTVNTVTSEHLNIGWWNFGCRCNAQKSQPSSKLGVIAPPGCATPKNVVFCYVTTHDAKCKQSHVGRRNITLDAACA